MRFFSESALEKLPPLFIGLAVLACLCAIKYFDPPFIQASRNLFFDQYQRLSPRKYAQVPVRILDIDEESIARFGQWPWDRKKIAEIVDRLTDKGVAVVVFDVLFSEADRTSPRKFFSEIQENLETTVTAEQLPDYDEMLASSIARGRVVTSFVLANDTTGGRRPQIKRSFAVIGDDPKPYITNFKTSVPALEVLEVGAAGNGAINFIPELDGVIRKAPLVFRIGDELYPTLVTEALRVAQGKAPLILKSVTAGANGKTFHRPGITNVGIGAFNLKTNEFGEIFLHYTHHVQERTYPIWRLLDDAQPIPDKAIQGNIVLIGTSAAGLLDMRFEPLGNVVPGVQMHAQALEQIISTSYLQRPEWSKGIELLFLIVAGLIVVVTASVFGALPSALVGGVVVLTGIGAAWYAFVGERFLIDPFSPSVFALISYAAAASSRYFITERKQRFVRQAFSSYVSPNLVDHIVAGEGTLTLGGERREVSFVFTDLESFTAMVEDNDPSIIMPILNEYLDEMIGIVFDHGGTVDKVVGDALHVMFSAPVAQEKHADLAVECALAMDRFAQEFRARVQEYGLFLGRTRIGVNTGEVVVGNFGGNRLFDYTAHGDAINTVARLEMANKATGTRVCVASNTVSLCSSFSWRPIADLVLRGKQQVVSVFEPLRSEDDETAWLDEYLHAYEKMKAGDPDAMEAFRNLEDKYPDDALVTLHLRRLSKGEAGIRMIG